MEPARYEWDEEKRVENLKKHGIDFLAVRAFNWAEAIVDLDDRYAYGEPRFLAYGPINRRLYAMVFTPRDGVRRLISFRKANRREQAAYLARMAGRRG